MRHYSRETLKAYRAWMVKFQAFVGSRPTAELETRDVKAFLSDLAVRQGCRLLLRIRRSTRCCSSTRMCWAGVWPSGGGGAREAKALYPGDALATSVAGHPPADGGGEMSARAGWGGGVCGRVPAGAAGAEISKRGAGVPVLARPPSPTIPFRHLGGSSRR